jgi:hypothetical protein
MENRISEGQQLKVVGQGSVGKVEERKSVPTSNPHPYNASLIKTFESSEFEQACPELLPGMIFGMQGGFSGGAGGADGEKKGQEMSKSREDFN